MAVWLLLLMVCIPAPANSQVTTFQRSNPCVVHADGFLDCFPPEPTKDESMSLSVSYEVGRTYSIPNEQFIIGHMPGIELVIKDFTMNFLSQFNSSFSQRLETDFGVSYEKRLTERSSISLNYSLYVYPSDIPTDQLWYVELKHKLWKK